MKRLLVVLALVSSSAALADVGLRNGGTYVGPVRDLNCTADGGIVCTRASSAVQGNLACATATATATGCMTTSAQALAGNKTLNGNLATTGVVTAPMFDGGAAVIGSIDIRNSTVTNQGNGSTLLIQSYTTDGTASPTAGAITLKCTALVAGDSLCVDVQNAFGSHVLGVNKAGTVMMPLHGTQPATATGQAGQSFTSTVGAAGNGDVSTAGGAGGTWTATAGNGGNAGTAAGVGGDANFSAGNGGADNGSVAGGHGGSAFIASGSGGPGSFGGSLDVFSGAGGNASASHTAGVGGVITIGAGLGGSSASGGAGAPGGAVTVQAGTGGTDTAAFNPGAGGVLTLKSGNGGAVGSGSGAPSGLVAIDTGASSGGATNGVISIGVGNANAVTIGRSGKTTTLPGTVALSGPTTATGGFAFGSSGTGISASPAFGIALDFPLIAAQTCSELTIGSMTNCVAGDPVFCGSPSTLPDGFAVTCYMSGAATATVRLCNVTSAGINPTSQTFQARCFH